MNAKNYKWLGLLVIPLLVFGVFIATNNKDIAENAPEQGARIDGWVTIYKTDAITGESSIIKNHEHNIMTNRGLDIVRQHLTTGSVEYPTNITLGTGASPGAATTTLAGKFTDSGLVASAGCTLANTTTGNWTCAYVFTATGIKNDINLTALYTPNGDMFAGANFTNTNLAVNDQLTVNWTITVS